MRQKSDYADEWSVGGALAAKRFDLNDDGNLEWIVKGASAYLIGAKIGPWWIYLQTKEDGAIGCQQLFAAGSLGVTILRQSTGGFHDIESYAVTATGPISVDIFGFDGRRYQHAESREEPRE